MPNDPEEFRPVASNLVKLLFGTTWLQSSTKQSGTSAVWRVCLLPCWGQAAGSCTGIAATFCSSLLPSCGMSAASRERRAALWLGSWEPHPGCCSVGAATFAASPYCLTPTPHPPAAQPQLSFSPAGGHICTVAREQQLRRCRHSLQLPSSSAVLIIQLQHGHRIEATFSSSMGQIQWLCRSDPA